MRHPAIPDPRGGRSVTDLQHLPVHLVPARQPARQRLLAVSWRESRAQPVTQRPVSPPASPCSSGSDRDRLYSCSVVCSPAEGSPLVTAVAGPAPGGVWVRGMRGHWDSTATCFLFFRSVVGFFCSKSHWNETKGPPPPTHTHIYL